MRLLPPAALVKWRGAARCRHGIDYRRCNWYEVVVNQSDSSTVARRIGFISAISAFTFWGIMPLYWTRIGMVPALEVLGHRILWSGLLAWAIVLLRRFRVRRSGAPLTDPLMPRGRDLRWLLLGGFLVVVNWFFYVWAVSSGRTLDASLGYYINPLVSVLLGMVFLGERLSRLQWAALACAVGGVLFLTLRLGVFPWVSLVLAFTFGTYGLIKKRAIFPVIHSLAVEMVPFILVALVFLGYLGRSGQGSFLAGSAVVSLLLWGAGAVSIAPLLLFAVATRRIRLADVGFLQYIAPTMMFILSVAVFRDPLEPARLTGFAFVWLGLVLYTISNFRFRHKQ